MVLQIQWRVSALLFGRRGGIATVHLMVIRQVLICLSSILDGGAVHHGSGGGGACSSSLLVGGAAAGVVVIAHVVASDLPGQIHSVLQAQVETDFSLSDLVADGCHPRPRRP